MLMAFSVTRREVIKAAAFAGVAAVAGDAAIGAAAGKAGPVVDTHVHCFAGADDKRFPYHEKGPYKPPVAATPEQLLKCMDGAGVDYAIIVHPEPYQDDHSYLEHCLQIGKGRLKGTCLFFADREGSAAGMAALVKKVPIVAARIHAYAPDRQPPFGKPELRAFWKQAADLGLAIQLHFEPRYAPGFGPLIKEFADTTVIIDHLGRPFQGTPQEHEMVIRGSQFKNTIMKVSSVPKATEYPHRDIGPTIKQLTEAWGADRMIYGGGFNADATPESYRAERERIRGYLAHLSDIDQAKIMGGTAARLFKFNANS
jgi:predicted TIM-barrel fold metal-dependent hydrolase